MRLIRCHVESPLATGRSLQLPEDKSLHLLRVLRLEIGDTLLLFNGDGFDYRAVLRGSMKKSAEVEVFERQAAAAESPLRIRLLQGIARGEKMDLVLRKATELGVAAIVPVTMERTEVKLDAERGERRLHHWRGVVAAACEQSGRATIPTVDEPSTLAEALARLTPDAQCLRLDPAGQEPLGALGLSVDKPVVLVVGPEGGLGERDHQILDRFHFRRVPLGPRILRTETAGLAALSALQALYGDWR